jgi:multidrug transporter EmrE-like cation transporter
MEIVSLLIGCLPLLFCMMLGFSAIKRGQKSLDTGIAYAMKMSIEYSGVVSYEQYCLEYSGDLNNKKLRLIFETVKEMYDYERTNESSLSCCSW